MQNSDSEKTRTATDRDDEASNSDGAVEEVVGDRDDEAPSHDGAEETSADRESDDPNRGEGTVAERDDEDPNRDTEQAAGVTGTDRDDRDRKDTRKSVSKGDCVWTMYLPSTSGKETLAVSNNNYGCEHYKRKSKFVVSSRMT